MPALVFQSVLSAEEWRAGGRELGLNCRRMSQGDFEAQIVRRLIALENLFGAISDEAVTAYDQGAWEGWDVGRGYPR